MYVRIKGRIYKVYEENGEFYIIKRIPQKERINPDSVIQGDPPKKPKKIGINVGNLIDSDKKLRDTVEKLQNLTQKEKSLKEDFERAKNELILCEKRNGELIAMIMEIASSKGFKKETALQVLKEIKIFIDNCSSEMQKIAKQNLRTIRELEERVAKLTEDVNECNTELGRRPRDCNDALKRAQDLEEELGRRPRDCNDALKRAQDLEEELSRFSKEHDSVLKRLRDLETENEQLRQIKAVDCSPLEERIAQLLIRIDKLEKQPPDCSEIERQLADARELIQSLQLENVASDCSREEERISELSSALERNTAKLRELSEANARLEQQLTQKLPENCDEYIAQVKKLQDALVTGNEENALYMSELSSLRALYETKMENCNNEYNRHEEVVESLKRAYTKLEEQCKALNKDLDVKYNQLLEEFNSLSESNKNMERKMKEQERELRNAQVENQRLQEEGEEIVAENERFFKELRDAKTNILRRERENEAVSLENEKLRLQINEMRVDHLEEKKLLEKRLRSD